MSLPLCESLAMRTSYWSFALNRAAGTDMNIKDTVFKSDQCKLPCLQTSVSMNLNMFIFSNTVKRCLISLHR